MLRLPRFIKRFVRKYTRPKIPEKANKDRSKISLLYAFITWNLLGLVAYKIISKKSDIPPEEQVSDGRYFADKLGIKNATLIRMSGFSKVGQWDLEEEKRLHGKLLTDLELAAVKKGQQLRKEPGEQEQHQESDPNESGDFDVERPLE